MQYEGKIGYGISPSERQKGYAAMQLLLTLEKCRERGMKKDNTKVLDSVIISNLQVRNINIIKMKFNSGR